MVFDMCREKLKGKRGSPNNQSDEGVCPFWPVVGFPCCVADERTE